MAEDFQSNNWWNTSKSSNEHSDSNFKFSGFGYSASSSDWSQTPISSGIDEPSLHAMLQEDMSTRNFCRQELQEMNLPLSLGGAASSSSTSSPSYGCSATMPMIQSLIEPDTKYRQVLFDNQQMTDYQSQMMAYGGGSNEIQHNPLLLNYLAQKQQSADINQMQFTNTSSFWNASSGFYHSSFSPIETQFCETKPSFNFLTAKSPEELQEKKSSSESVQKKPRLETPAPFKVRKEKLGDRITALQQLVSPFGKTDTASVLHEAIVYIKFLHDQVSALSTPYLMNAQPMEHQKNSGKSKKREEARQDLRSRGLCLVPIASTYTVTSEASPDLWTPTFGGTYS
uniref:Transcription factor bHLH112-like isoform X4 n=1 Tax=Cymbidium ensifolium TaxID=78740 RepID=A0A515HG37_CYMEN|nr:transcription factor bHLH112-like isoform X4 [Cymbidium ensifolium]